MQQQSLSPFHKPNPSPSLKPAIWAVLVHLSLIVVVYFGMTSHVEQPVEVELWDSAGVEAVSSSAVAPAVSEPTQSPTVEQAIEKQVEKPQAQSTLPAEINTPTTKKTTETKPATVEPKITTTKPQTPTTTAQDTSRADAARDAMLARMKGSTGSNAASGNSSNDAGAYIGRVKQRVEAQAKLRIAGQTLSAVVSVRLDPAGNVTSKTMQQSSGNAAWDTDLMAAISRASPFPTPVHPEALKGIRLTFRH